MSEEPKLKSAFHEELLEIEVKALRDERDRLRKVIDDIRKKSYEPDPERPELSTRAQIQLMAEAALTPAAPALTPNEATE